MPASKPIIFTDLARALGRNAMAVIIIDSTNMVVKILTQGDIARPLESESPKNTKPKNRNAIASPSTIKHRDL